MTAAAWRYRHGSERTKVVMGGEKRDIQRPRVRIKEGAELSLPTLAVFQDEEPLNQAVLARLLAEDYPIMMLDGMAVGR